MKVLGGTSKAIHNFVQKELNDQEKLEQLLHSYEKMRLFNVQTLKEVDLFCIGEVHDDPQCESTEFELVDLLASRGPVIYIAEGWPSMKPFHVDDLENHLRQNKSFNTAFRDNIYCIGWDDQQKLKELQHEATQRYEESEAQLQEQMMENTRISFPGWISTHDRKAFFATFEKTLSSLQEQVKEDVMIQEKLNTLHTSYRRYKFKWCLLKLQRDVRLHKTILQETFPIRTASQVTTLEKLDRFLSDKQLRHAKVVVVAGNEHWKTADENQTTPEFDVTRLYEQLNHHKACILLPTEAISRLQAKIEQTQSDSTRS